MYILVRTSNGDSYIAETDMPMDFAHMLETVGYFETFSPDCLRQKYIVNTKHVVSFRALEAWERKNIIDE